MAPILFHGSAKKIGSGFLLPNIPSDLSKRKNLRGVYATNVRAIALGMAIASIRGIEGFADYESRPFKFVLVNGSPKGSVYLYTLPKKGFKEEPKRSGQFISPERVRILSVEKLGVEKLGRYWRKATAKEKKWFLGFTHKHSV